ncbi:MAG TPA: CoA transferase [Caulobacteraceae bacterium]|nr:CoA transferase [Caulobacteraceae bacterium]
MSPIAPVLARQSAEIAALTAALGRPVDVAALEITDRLGQLPLDRPSARSPNRACRLVRCADGWLAVNLARDEDRDLVGAWLGRDAAGDAWAAIARAAARRGCAGLLADAILLGLPAARVGEVGSAGLKAPLVPAGAPSARRRGTQLRVVDLSALWAGPLCAAVLAELGAGVVKVESLRRPDPTRTSTPGFFRRLNGRKDQLALDLGAADGQARLRELILAADVLVTSARPRAFVSLGLAPGDLFAANPSLVWVAVTGYGWTGAAAERVGFGDDTAAAGGLVRWTAGGAPRFLGDALADPVTGLAAAIGALRALLGGGGVLVDAAMAVCAAGAAACGLPSAP